MGSPRRGPRPQSVLDWMRRSKVAPDVNPQQEQPPAQVPFSVKTEDIVTFEPKQCRMKFSRGFLEQLVSHNDGQEIEYLKFKTDYIKDHRNVMVLEICDEPTSMNTLARRKAGIVKITHDVRSNVKSVSVKGLFSNKMNNREIPKGKRSIKWNGSARTLTIDVTFQP